jgi:3-hydroxybutyryl-CoA dehydratase
VVRNMSEAKFFEKRFSITDQAIRAFAEVSQDRNPIHLDETYAAGTMFKGRICHGMLIGSFISAIIGNDFPGMGTIYVSQNMKFRRPVRIGDEITIRITVIESLEKGRIKLDTICKNQMGESVVEGEAIVIPPANFMK